MWRCSAEHWQVSGTVICFMCTHSCCLNSAVTISQTNDFMTIVSLVPYLCATDVIVCQRDGVLPVCWLAHRKWSLTSDKLQRIMNFTAWVITNTWKFDHGLSHVRHEILHWLDVPECVTFKLCSSVYKRLHGMGPPYLSEMCLPILSLPGRRHLRSAVCGQLAVPRYRVTTAGKRVFSFTGPSAWNGFPAYLKDDSLNLDSLKCSLKSFLFDVLTAHSVH